MNILGLFRRERQPESDQKSADKSKSDQQRDLLATGFFLLAVVLPGLAGVYAYSPGAAPTSLLWAGGCLATGITVGFLFGIPRTLQSGNEAGSDATRAVRSRYEQLVNTNLEQISDWLTKILVGITLTQLNSIGAKLDEAARYISPGLGGDANAHVFGAALILYFSVAGFMSGYLLTRLFVAGAFWRADTSTRLSAVEDKATKLDLALTELEQKKQEDRLQADINGALQILDGKERDYLLSNAPDIIHSYVNILEQHLAAKPVPSEPLYRRLNIVLARLYDEKLKQRGRAIEILKKYIGTKEQQGSGQDEHTAAAFYNQACYLSLKAAETTDPEEKKGLQTTAIEALRNSVARDPRNRAEAKKDPDLDAIRDLPEFKTLIETGAD